MKNELMNLLEIAKGIGYMECSGVPSFNHSTKLSEMVEEFIKKYDKK